MAIICGLTRKEARNILEDTGADTALVTAEQERIARLASRTPVPDLNYLFAGPPVSDELLAELGGPRDPTAGSSTEVILTPEDILRGRVWPLP